MNNEKIVKFIDYGKFAAAGAMGGLAVVNTFNQIVFSSPATDSVESVAMAAGATLIAGLVKVLHVV